MENRNMFLAIGIAITFLLVTGAVVGPLNGFDSKDEQKNYVVEDATGEEIGFEEPPERIVSFMPSNTELLFHLEVGDRVVGVDDFSNHPKETLELPKVGDSMEVDYEKIIDLEPDVVVTTKSQVQMRERLEEADIKTVVTGGETLEDVYSDLELLGKMCGLEERGKEKAKSLRGQMDEITDNIRDLPEDERADVLYISGTSNGIYTPGEGTFQNTLLTNAGADNIASDKSGWATISEAEIVDRDPEFIIAPNYIEQGLKEYTEKDSWQDITAVEKDQIHFVDGDVMSRPGPRVVQAQQTLIDIIQQTDTADSHSVESGQVKLIEDSLAPSKEEIAVV